MRFLRVLRNINVRRLWVSQIISAIGDRFYDLAVVWIATREVGAAAGGVVLAGSLVTLVFGLFGGVYADRWNRRRTMIAVDLIRAAVLLVLVAVAAFGDLHIWHFVIVTAINVGMNALFEPTLVASLRVVTQDADELQAANALMDATWRVSTAFAPTLAGFLLATVAVHTLFLLDSLTFLLSALAIFSLSRNLQWQPVVEAQTRGSILADLRGAVRVVLAHRPLTWALVTGILLGNVVWGLAFTVGIPLFADQVLGGDAQVFGLIVAAYGVGNVLSNIVVGNLTIRRRSLFLFGGSVVLGVGFMVLASAQTLPMAMAGAFLASLGGPMGDIMLLMIIQDELPSTQIGKVYSLRMVTAEIGYALGLGLALPVYNLVDVPVGIALSGLLLIVGGGVALLRMGFRSHTALAGEVQG